MGGTDRKQEKVLVPDTTNTNDLAPFDTDFTFLVPSINTQLRIENYDYVEDKQSKYVNE